MQNKKVWFWGILVVLILIIAVYLSPTAFNDGKPLVDTSTPSDPVTSNVGLNLPPEVFNATGAILEVNENEIIVSSSGSHYEDPPENSRVKLTVKVDNSTNFFSPGGDPIRLSTLEKGHRVSIEGESNIKNEANFTASNIRIIK